VKGHKGRGEEKCSERATFRGKLRVVSRGWQEKKELRKIAKKRTDREGVT